MDIKCIAHVTTEELLNLVFEDSELADPFLRFTILQVTYDPKTKRVRIEFESND